MAVNDMMNDMDTRIGLNAGSNAAKGLAVSARNISKRFGDKVILHDLNLAIAPGEFLAIVGRSGCGKSTLLRLMGGLDDITSGSLTIDGRSASGINQDTRIMFQEHRLLPWRSVLQNVGLGMTGDWEQSARDALDQVGLSDKADDWPSMLSGGQRQRVALARALVHQPRLLLLDEPLGALDALTRIEMQRLIESLWLRNQFSVVLITHDVDEAIAMADRVVLIDNGRIGLDQRIPLSRPRQRSSGQFGELTDLVLNKVLAK